MYHHRFYLQFWLAADQFVKKCNQTTCQQHVNVCQSS